MDGQLEISDKLLICSTVMILKMLRYSITNLKQESNDHQSNQLSNKQTKTRSILAEENYKEIPACFTP